MTCDWCGADHPREQLCAGRPRWSRRGFLALFGAGVAGLVFADTLPTLGADEHLFGPSALVDGGAYHYMTVDAILKDYYADFICQQVNRPDPFAELTRNGEWTAPAGVTILTRRSDGRD